MIDGAARVRRAGFGAAVENVSWHELWSRDGGRCHVCGGATLADYENTRHPLAPTVDHIVPVASGGAHTLSNLAIAHFTCNVRRSRRAADDASPYERLEATPELARAIPLADVVIEALVAMASVPRTRPGGPPLVDRVSEAHR